ncbi:unnamed protein product [Sphagnum jensenii]|uniref:SMP-30/Gluconolactonase/LRE-like region domain-containing protein n=1 Tax=Sphagnum jensenii TaxID=128206 RepID=A0ABP1B4Z4_9BRYO
MLKPMATVGTIVVAMLALWLSLTPWSKFQGGEGGEAFLATQIKWLNSVAKKKYELPNAACFWQQGSIINNIPTGPSDPDCLFEVRDPDFLEVLGVAPTLELVVNTDAHEGGVYFPDTDEFYFASSRRKLGYLASMTSDNKVAHAGDANTEVKKVSLKTRNVSTVFRVTDVANGMALDNDGNLLICQQGQGAKPGYIERVDLKNLNSSIVADNWFGVPFNSPNDVVVKSDGSIWFTDPSYGRAQGFRAKPQVSNQVYRISMTGVVDAVASDFQQPNGLAFSEDEKRLYVTDTGFETGFGDEFDPLKHHHIYVFDILPDGSLGSRRLFASVGMYDGSSPGLGVPDGIKIDTKGRVYVGSPDGVQVFSRTGKSLGLIRLPGACNLGFAGEQLNKLYVLNDKSIRAIKLQATAAGLRYARRFKHQK